MAAAEPRPATSTPDRSTAPADALAEYVRRVVDTAPPLSDATVDKIAGLLRCTGE